MRIYIYRFVEHLLFEFYLNCFTFAQLINQFNFKKLNRLNKFKNKAGLIKNDTNFPYHETNWFNRIKKLRNITFSFFLKKKKVGALVKNGKEHCWGKKNLDMVYILHETKKIVLKQITR